MFRVTPLAALVLGFAVLTAACSSGSDAITSDEPAEVSDSETDSSETSDTESSGTESSDAESTDSETNSSAASGADTVTGAVAAAEALFAVLTEDEISTLSYEYGDSAILTSWSNLPACDTNGRAGIRHGNLTEEQTAAVMAVTQSVMSDEGYTEYSQIIAADEELGGGDGAVWDADCYYLAFFGTPSTTEDWGLQFGGHHYARTVTFSDGRMTVTPAFTGVEPRSFIIDGETVEPLRDEGESILAVFDSLSDDQLAAADLGGGIGAVQLGPGSDTFPATEGLMVSELPDETQALVLAAIRTWVDDFDPATAEVIMAKIEAELDETAIGWSNSIDYDTEGAYGRIDGPSVWIEFANEGGVGGNDVHQHSVYRDKNDDYGSAA